MTEEQKEWKVVDVPFGKSLKNYAEKLETTLNQMSKEGRVTTMVQVGERGVVIMGRLPITIGISTSADSGPSVRTRRLAGPLLRALSEKTSQELTQMVDAVLAVTPNDVVNVAIAELEQDAAQHTAAHQESADCGSGCNGPAELTRVSALLKERLKARLQ